MHLSRLILNPRNRAVQLDLGNVQGLHRTVMSAFPQTEGTVDARASLGVLYRLEVDNRTGRIVLQVQSNTAPKWSALPPRYVLDTNGEQENPACKSIDEAYQRLRPGMALRFRLRANPTRKIDTKSGPDGQRRNGKRVELRAEEDQIAWLGRKGDAAGFRLLSIRPGSEVPCTRIFPEDKLTGRRPDQRRGPTNSGERKITFGAALFEGPIRALGYV